ncbi:hypothetical protein PV327_006177 [Microctonus hyperodae]|uniref:Uncharacterized protein n=1 Tax=Microctonus hyperodae TaxID=165561 RepID=A0AA39F3S4_MICHY|nr:hypothetical protein PV327_006177 [Microctonus hyperodae]
MHFNKFISFMNDAIVFGEDREGTNIMENMEGLFFHWWLAMVSFVELDGSLRQYGYKMMYHKQPKNFSFIGYGDNVQLIKNVSNEIVANSRSDDDVIILENAHSLEIKFRRDCKGILPPANTRRHGETNLLHEATLQVIPYNYSLINSFSSRYLSKYLDAKNELGQTEPMLIVVIGLVTPLHNYFSMHVEVMYPVPSNTGFTIAMNALVNPRTVANDVPADLVRQNDHNECVQ